MQLDHTQIAIRERSLLCLLDLALRVVATHAGPLLAALALGVLPVALLDHWLVHAVLDLDPMLEEEGAYALYLFGMMALVAWQMPLATALVTLYLGQALFDQRPPPRVLLRQFLGSLPQLIWYQVFVRAIWLFVVPFGIVYPFSYRPYLNEVILLERNPLRGQGRMTTGARAASLHASVWGDLFLQWLTAIVFGLLLIVSIIGSCYLMRGELLGNWEHDWIFISVCYPMSIWLVIGYLAVFRFLAYLDLRIRREGWELELLVRAESDRLKRRLV